jgi:2-oxoisovalerate dehydrogenase E1 component
MLTQGTELTLVTWGAMVYACLGAPDRFPGQVEVIDLRTIVPWDRQTMLTSIARTGKALVVHAEPLTAGFGAEIVATPADGAFEDLDPPIRRMAMPDCPIPYNAELMDRILPNEETISQGITDLLEF